MTYTEKLPPHDIDAEEAVLGSILIDGDAIGKVADTLTPGQFYRDKNRHVYQAALTLHDAGQGVNQVTVAHQLDMAGHLDEIGGPAYLSHLVSIIPTPLHAPYYAGIVAKCWTLRQLIAQAGEIISTAYEGKVDISEPLERLLTLTARDEAHATFQTMRQISDDTFNDFEEFLEAGSRPATLLTGLVPLDRTLNGLGRGRMYVFAGRPGVGKSDLARCLAESVARQGKAVGYVSLEMPRADIFERALFAFAGIDRRAITPLGATDEQKQRLRDARGVLDALRLSVLDAPALPVRAIRAHAQALRAAMGGLDLLIVDHLGLVGDMPGRDAYDRVTEISGRLMALAKTLDIPVIALAQLNRSCDSRPGDHRPRLSDLRDSGAIEQDAYAVTFLWRYDYYREREDPAFEVEKPSEHNVLHLYTDKNRGGPCGEHSLYYDTATGRLGPLDASR